MIEKPKVGVWSRKGLLLWGLLLFGYFLFLFNLVVMNNLKGGVGEGGWIDVFFSSTPSTSATHAVNYTLTFMRAFGSILAGYFLTRFGHKKSVIIALVLFSFSFITVLTGYIGNTSGYVLFILGRMIMAIGGTVLIIYTQPVISKYFSKNQKGLLSRINSFGTCIGAAFPLILFSIDPIRESMINHWQIWAFVISGAPIILLIIYIIKGECIEIEKIDVQKLEEIKESEIKPATLKSALKDKNTWKLSIYYGFWLIAFVSALLILPNTFAKLHVEVGNFSKLKTWEILLPVILFLFGIVPGMPVVGWILHTKVERKFYIAFISFLVVLFIIGAYLCTVYTKNIIGTSIFMLLAGTMLFGIQGVALNMPHEIKTNSPQRVGVVISCAWGIGYLIFTIANIISSLIFDAIYDSNNQNLELASWVKFGILLSLIMGMPVVAFFWPKTQNISLKEHLRNKRKKK